MIQNQARIIARVEKKPFKEVLNKLMAEALIETSNRLQHEEHGDDALALKIDD
jgi:hypothetical protein